jgi:hypothetical protein
MKILHFLWEFTLFMRIYTFYENLHFLWEFNIFLGRCERAPTTWIIVAERTKSNSSSSKTIASKIGNQAPANSNNRAEKV